MSIKTILENLFGRVMKNGKRIPGTCILAFGTRIFFEDYLLPDDIIICTDWADFISMRARGKYKHIEFLSESEVKKMVDKGTLYNYIERKYRMRKFDLVVSNPPYDGDLHLQILDTFLKISKQCVFVHPARWMEDVLAQYKAKSATGKKYEHLKTALTKVMLIRQKEGTQVFHIKLTQDMMIGIYEGCDMNSSLPIYKNSKMYFDILRRVMNYVTDIKSMKSLVDENEINGIRVEVRRIIMTNAECDSELCKQRDVWIVNNQIVEDGYVNGVFWSMNKKNTKTNGKKIGTPIPRSIKFESKELAQAFIDLYRTNVVMNIIHILKYGPDVFFDYFPYFDPKTIKTEDDVLNALGITEPEYREWLKRKVDDYREKDFIKYNEWIDC